MTTVTEYPVMSSSEAVRSRVNGSVHLRTW